MTDRGRTCTHYIDGRCSLRLFNCEPTEKQCASCGRYRGPLRGAGDVIHAVATLGGVPTLERLASKCGGCGRRRAKLNG